MRNANQIEMDGRHYGCDLLAEVVRDPDDNTWYYSCDECGFYEPFVEMNSHVWTYYVHELGPAITLNGRSTQVCVRCGSMAFDSKRGFGCRRPSSSLVISQGDEGDMIVEPELFVVEVWPDEEGEVFIDHEDDCVRWINCYNEDLFT